MQSRSQTIRLVRNVTIAFLIIIIVGYAFWRSFSYARGPAIIVDEPLDGSGIASSSVIIVGRAERLNDVTLDGRTISIDEKGKFSETLVIFSGMNIITLEGRDQFGRKVRKELSIVGTI